MRLTLVSLGSRDRFGGFDRSQLGLAYLHASVESDPVLASRVQVSHRVHDAELSDRHAILDDVLASDPDVVGFGCYVWNTPLALWLADELKRRRPALRVVFGGPDAETLPLFQWQAHPGLDLVVRGEGEETIRELLANLDEGRAIESVAGLTYRQGRQVQQTMDRPLIRDLDTIPSPYLGGQLAPHRGCYVETLRGCPFHCTFCAWGETKARAFSIDRVKAELDHLNRPDVRAVMFVDSIFNLNRRRAHEILEYVLEIDFQPWIWLELYPRLIDERTLDLLRQVKKAYVGVGIQTVTPASMQRIQRVWEPDQIATLLDRMTPGHDPCFSMEFIMGLPDDDLEGFLDTVTWVFRRKPGALVCSHLHVLPRSDLLVDADGLGLVFDADQRNRLISSPTMTSEQVAVGHRICGWVERWQAILYRLARWSGRPAGPLIRDWVAFLETEGLQELADSYLELNVEPAVMESLLDALHRFTVREAVSADPVGLADRLRVLARYILARLVLIEDGWHHFEGLDVAGIRFQSQGRIEPPWRSVSVVDHRGPLPLRGPRAVLDFPFDPEALLVAEQVEDVLAVDAEPCLYFVFAHPTIGASRACRVEAAEASAIEQLEQGAAVEELDETGRRVAAGLIEAGLTERRPVQRLARHA